MQIIAIDTETYYDPDFDGMSIWIKGSPQNKPFCATVSDATNDDFVTDWSVVKTIAEDATIAKIGANLKYDWHMLLNMGIDLKGEVHDVLVIHHLLDEEAVDANGKRIFGLKAIADKYLGEGSSDLEKQVDALRTELARETNRGKEEVSYKDVYDRDPELMMAYALQDTRITYDLFFELYPRLEEEGLLGVYKQEMATMRVLVQVERNGMRVDKPYLEELGATLDAELEALQSRLTELGGDFNPNSANELVAVLEGLGVVYEAKTEKGEWDTSAKTLERLANREAGARELIEVLLAHREIAKLRETYVTNLLAFIQRDGRVHPTFNQIGTVTGRMSCSNPALQTLPSHEMRIRRAFIPEEGKRLYFLDFAQQEYRLLAHYAREHSLIKSIEQGRDVHKATASMLFGKAYDDVTDDERSSGKTLNFAMVYGLGLGSIATVFGQPFNELHYKTFNAVTRRLGVLPWKADKTTLLNSVTDVDERAAIEYYYSQECTDGLAFAKKQKKMYFDNLPSIDNFLKQAQAKCRQRGWVMTWTGRRRRFRKPSEEAYKAPNAIIQGGCGDILKNRLPLVQKYIDESGADIKIVNLIHDEQVFETAPENEHHIYKIKEILEIDRFSVPMDVGVAWSDTNWAEAVEE